jgi:transposase
MVATSKSRKKVKRSRSRKFRQAVLGKPSGVIQPRVQDVGPEHFGIVAIDCAKDRSKWLLANFYGTLLVEPTNVEHQRLSFELSVTKLREAMKRHAIKDVIVCIEMTGTYHKPVQRAFRKAGFETRIVHPFASSHYRMPEHGDIKTDDNDLAAIFRAAVNGFGLIEKPVGELYRKLQILSRCRRDLVNKRSKLQCQIRHHLEHCLPGFAALFRDTDLWTQATPIPILKAIADHGATPQAVVEAGVTGLRQWLVDAGVTRLHQATMDRVVAWASNAASHDEMATTYARVWRTLLDDWLAKQEQILELERDLASVLVRTPYLLLLSHPGINVISAAELAGETGPIENYASPRSISGRSGLFPSRYQSDQVDRGGNLSRYRNARMRAAWMLVADNMVKCNAYWRTQAARWEVAGAEPRDVRTRIANRMTRIVFRMVSGRQLFEHPSRLDRMYVMDKLLVYLQDHNVPPGDIVRHLENAAEQIPPAARQAEAKPLIDVYKQSKRSRRKEPQQLSTLLVGVLARLGIAKPDVEAVESK